ncbi:hypothetical protein DICPUDRAFT_85124 [Dictyostelium purpureum]|uniref:Uncharacterized protein n=1 Tax=Dictyostelium purpureum TaxID=5786 RepID=F1A4S4_DICPU|nr:uncharacterized protein DICPUDRAFT_85124 [Dictyostelium purpureum]EGC28805.1 hypothetical protein DICPUDRAFT_85124 [Dictyostelium purpureum]|eukprot:XP_003294667.1 hypothetical protein DICPUDRAFT_85124 [Dictyostelium purpureum]
MTPNNDFFKIYRNSYLKSLIHKELRIYNIVNQYTKKYENGFNNITLESFKFKQYIVTMHYKRVSRINCPIFWDSITGDQLIESMSNFNNKKNIINNHFNYDLFDNQDNSEDYQVYEEPNLNDSSLVICEEPIKRNLIPNSVQYLIIHLNQDINETQVIPSSVTDLRFGNYFDSNIVEIPNNVKKLTFGCYYQHYLTSGMLPESIKELYLPLITRKLQPNVFPHGLESLEFAYSYKNQVPSEEEKQILPKTLKNLTIYNHDAHITEYLIPKSVQIFKYYQSNPSYTISPSFFPNSVKVLYIDQPFYNFIPPSVETLGIMFKEESIDRFLKFLNNSNNIKNLIFCKSSIEIFEQYHNNKIKFPNNIIDVKFK